MQADNIVSSDWGTLRGKGSSDWLCTSLPAHLAWAPVYHALFALPAPPPSPLFLLGIPGRCLPLTVLASMWVSGVYASTNTMKEALLQNISMWSLYCCSFSGRNVT